MRIYVSWLDHFTLLSLNGTDSKGVKMLVPNQQNSIMLHIQNQLCGQMCGTQILVIAVRSEDDFHPDGILVLVDKSEFCGLNRSMWPKIVYFGQK